MISTTCGMNWNQDMTFYTLKFLVVLYKSFQVGELLMLNYNIYSYYKFNPMKIKDLPKHLRPRERLLEKGVDNLKDSELMAILLRTGKEGKNAIELASQILKKYPMSKLLSLRYEELIKIPGIDNGKACTLLAGFELTRRGLNMSDNIIPSINSPQDIAFLLSDLATLKKEHFICLYLNARSQVIARETISIGIINSSLVHPREVFEPAIKNLSVQIVLAHNHPSNSLLPSISDIQITKKLIDAGKILGIEVIDHIIIVKNNFHSMRENKEGFIN